MSNAEVFEDHFRTKGGRLRPDKLLPQQERAIGSFLAAARNIVAAAQSGCKSPPPIYIDFIDTGEVNAWAFRDDGTYYIGLGAGVAAVYDLLFYRILADSRLLRRIGHTDRERGDLPPLRLLEPDSFYMADFGAAPMTPNDTTRQDYASLLHHLAFDFLVMHEVYHVIHGHVALLADMGQRQIAEAGWVPAGDEASTFRLTLEWDADASTAYRLLDRMFLDISDPNSQLIRQSPYLRDHATAMSAYVFATSALFRLFGDGEFRNVKLPAVGQLPARFRQIMALNTAFNRARRHGNAEQAAFWQEVVLGAARDVEEAFRLLTNESPTTSGLEDALGEPGQRYHNQLEAYWRGTLRDRLIPYAHIDLPE